MTTVLESGQLEWVLEEMTIVELENLYKELQAEHDEYLSLSKKFDSVKGNLFYLHAAYDLSSKMFSVTKELISRVWDGDM